MSVVELVIDFAKESIQSDIDSLPLKDLAGAVYSWRRPNKQLEEGNLIEFEEFSKTVYGPLFTSPGKASEVFDRIVLRVGNIEAVECIKQLDHVKEGYKRRSIREDLYIKTQALADLVNELSRIPEKERSQFNNLSLKIMKFIITDVSPENYYGE